VRHRRLRASAGVRRLVRETTLRPECLVLPLFAVEGRGRREPIASLPGHARLSPDLLVGAAREAGARGVGAVLLFGVTDEKDASASAAHDPDGVVQTAVARLKDATPELVVITDVCLCGYTDHGHCGLVEDGRVLNDASLEVLARVAGSHADAGADLVAPSDMMDGRVAAIRARLDAEGHEHVGVLSYAVKYASALYGPFRDAAGSAPGFGDRRGYQMDPANAREAVREAVSDVGEGADVVMVKPAGAYLDVITRVRDAVSVPVAAYHVSGEHSMIEAAAERGWLDRREAVLEILTGIRRAGADILVTYHAAEVAGWLA
jgi:porphobilinogen synthase